MKQREEMCICGNKNMRMRMACAKLHSMNHRYHREKENSRSERLPHHHHLCFLYCLPERKLTSFEKGGERKRRMGNNKWKGASAHSADDTIILTYIFRYKVHLMSNLTLGQNYVLKLNRPSRKKRRHLSYQIL